MNMFANPPLFKLSLFEHRAQSYIRKSNLGAECFLYSLFCLRIKLCTDNGNIKGKRQNFATQSQNLKATETRPAAAEAAPMTPLLYPSLSASSPPPYQGTTFEQLH